MSEEEKKAKEYFKKYINDFERRIGKNLTTEFNEHLKVLLNQVEKQQKEIEEKSTIIMAGAEKVKQLEEEIEELKLITRQYNSYCINTDDDEPRIILAHKHYFDFGVFTSNYISKDKIKERIEEARKINWHTPKLVIEYFEELLEEN